MIVKGKIYKFLLKKLKCKYIVENILSDHVTHINDGLFNEIYNDNIKFVEENWFYIERTRFLKAKYDTIYYCREYQKNEASYLEQLEMRKARFRIICKILNTILFDKSYKNDQNIKNILTEKYFKLEYNLLEGHIYPNYNDIDFI